MGEQNSVINSYVQEETTSITLRDLVNIVLYNWYWFVFSVVLCLMGAVIYLMWAPKIYERTATVLIKDDKSNSGETAVFQDLSIFEGKHNVNNEMIVFKSKSLMTEAVRRLKIDISYTWKDRLRLIEMYTNTPVMFTFLNIEETQPVSLKMKLLPDNEILLWDFKTENLISAPPVTALLNDTVKTPIGELVAIPTLWYNETWFNKTITVTKSPVANVIDHFRQAMTVSLTDKQTTAVNLSIKDESIQRAEDVLNTVIAIYNEDAINDKNTMAVTAENFINDRIIIIEDELGSVDRRIQTFKTQQQLTDMKSDAQLALQEGSEADRAIVMLQSQRTMAEYIRTYLADPANSTEMIPANTGVEDLKLEAQIANYNQTLIRRNRIIENSSERNVVVQELNSSLNSMRRSIMLAVDNLIVNLDIQIRAARARTERTRARIAAVPQQQSEVTSISRQQQIKEELYLYLLNKREENAINKAITESTARIIDPANGSAGPVAPRSMIILMAAFLLGLVFPSAVIYLLLLSDITVRGRKDLTSVLSIPFLGEVPYKKQKYVSDIDEILVRKSGRDPISEAFRIIRTNMDFMRVKQDRMQVIMTTSTQIGSGKTFVASNLAASLAMTGKKVILIDMDIRKGTLSRGLKISKQLDGHDVGLTSYLSKMVENAESVIVQDRKYENIDIIHSGPEPPNPAELLLSPRLDELIDQLRETYDYILIDNVPCEIVADAYISNRVVDLTLYIVRAGKIDRRRLPDIEQIYRDEKLKNMALILNGVGAGANFYGYTYGYYSYGYNNTYD